MSDQSKRDELDRKLAGMYVHPDNASYSSRDAVYSAYAEKGTDAYVTNNFSTYNTFSSDKDVPDITQEEVKIKRIFCPTCGQKSLSEQKGICPRKHTWKLE